MEYPAGPPQLVLAPDASAPFSIATLPNSNHSHVRRAGRGPIRPDLDRPSVRAAGIRRSGAPRAA